MKIYAFLRAHVSPRVAFVATVMWLAALIVLAVFFSFEPQAEFRYGNL